MLDRRLNAYRKDLADIRLEGQVEADRFVEGVPGRIVKPVVELRPRPDLECGMDTQLLMGETVTIFDADDGFAFVQAHADSYVGYLPVDSVSSNVTAPVTHHVIVPRTFAYPGPELRKPPVRALSLGSRIIVTGEAETRGTLYLLLNDGTAVIAAHCLPLDQWPTIDPVELAVRFLETPYLWGGRSGFGIDCSGLVQLCHQMTGRKPPRDSDMQRDGYGAEIAVDTLRRGDLVFWKGHVGMMEDKDILLHASGHTMTVTRELLSDAIARIGYLYGPPTICRRPE